MGNQLFLLLLSYMYHKAVRSVHVKLVQTCVVQYIFAIYIDFLNI